MPASRRSTVVYTVIGGFGLVAWPARHGGSGVMTFIVNHQGVYQKNLGPQTAELASGDRPLRPRSKLAEGAALTPGTQGPNRG